MIIRGGRSYMSMRPIPMGSRSALTDVDISCARRLYQMDWHIQQLGACLARTERFMSINTLLSARPVLSSPLFTQQ